MILAVGARYTSYLCASNAVLIAKKYIFICWPKMRDSLEMSLLNVAFYFLFVLKFFIWCCRLEGQKVLKANQWNIPVVGVHWLAELVMGGAAVIHNANHLRFKPQNYPDPFRIDLNNLPTYLIRKMNC